MTREQQIKQAATAKSRGETPYYYDAFVAGAEWADAHPDISVVSDPKTLDAELGHLEVTKTSDQELESKKLDADEVIAWLVANICDFEYYVKLFKKDFGL